jgi:hypothetical protein
MTAIAPETGDERRLKSVCVVDPTNEVASGNSEVAKSRIRRRDLASATKRARWRSASHTSYARPEWLASWLAQGS